MHVDLRVISTWGRDLTIAYAGGLVLGAPLAVLAVKLTDRELAATVCLVAAMAALFVLLRRRTPHARQDWGTVTPGGTPSVPPIESRVA